MPNPSALIQGRSHMAPMINSAEPQTGWWWENFQAAQAYHAKFGHWPHCSHPKLGKWILALDKELARVRGGHGSLSRKSSLSADRILAIRKARYTPTALSAGPNRNDETITRALKALENGENIAEADLTEIRNRFRSGNLRDTVAIKFFNHDITLAE